MNGCICDETTQQTLVTCCSLVTDVNVCLVHGAERGKAISPDICQEIFVVSKPFVEVFSHGTQAYSFVCSNHGFKETLQLAYFLQHTHTEHR